MEIIKMAGEHVQQVAALEAQCFQDPWSLRAITYELTNPLSLWLVAMQKDLVVGYVGSQTVMDEADMMNLAVDPHYRCTGIGRALVEELVSRLRSSGVRCLSLEVRVSNADAIRLYDSLGFSQVGRRPNYYRNPKEDALILRKEWEV